MASYHLCICRESSLGPSTGHGNLEPHVDSVCRTGHCGVPLGCWTTTYRSESFLEHEQKELTTEAGYSKWLNERCWTHTRLQKQQSFRTRKLDAHSHRRAIQRLLLSAVAGSNSAERVLNMASTASTQPGSKRWTYFHSALQLAIQRAAHKWT